VWIVIFTLGGFWLHPISFFLTGLVILSGTMYEYYSIIKTSGIRPQLITGILTGITGYTIATLTAAGILEAGSLLILIPLMLLIPMIELYRKQDRPFDSLAHTFFPLFYIGVPFSLFPFSAFGHHGLSTFLNHSQVIFSPGIVIGFFILLWTNDTAAYLVGITLGKHRLFERISPKKSWEGFAGSVVFALGTALVLFKLEMFPFAWYHYVIISLIISAFGMLGDLIESVMKRYFGVKDSGNIMPGHGGLLDRFDGALIALPIAVVYILFIIITV